MTAPTPELIARLRAEDHGWRTEVGEFPILGEAADALAAVTTEREDARRELAEQKRVNASNLRTMTVQLDQARQMLADAPHDNVTCATWYGPQDAACTCWKAGL